MVIFVRERRSRGNFCGEEGLELIIFLVFFKGGGQIVGRINGNI